MVGFGIGNGGEGRHRCGGGGVLVVVRAYGNGWLSKGILSYIYSMVIEWQQVQAPRALKVEW